MHDSDKSVTNKGNYCRMVQEEEVSGKDIGKSPRILRHQVGIHMLAVFNFHLSFENFTN